MTRIPLFIPAGLLAASMVHAQVSQQQPVGWHLVYAADSTGARTAGDKAALLAAVRAGQPVRLGWAITYRLPDSTTSTIEHFAEARFLTIHKGEVFAQIAPIIGQRPSAREAVIAFRGKNGELWYAMLDTTGRLRGFFAGEFYSTSQGADKTESHEQTSRTATFWYVQFGI